MWAILLENKTPSSLFQETTRHIGDLGNIAANDEGRSDVRIEDHMVSLLGENNVMGLAIVVHECKDIFYLHFPPTISSS